MTYPLPPTKSDRPGRVIWDLLHQVSGPEMNQWTYGINDLDRRTAILEAGQGGGAIGYATLTALNADLAHPDGTVAFVLSDSTPGNNGMYRKSGASGAGSWVASTGRVDGWSVLATGSTAPHPLQDRFANVHWSGDFSTLAEAVTAANASGKTLVIHTPMVALNAVPVTITAPLRFEGNGSIDTSAAGSSVTISGPLEARLARIFVTGSGTLSFQAKISTVYPQWWGAKDDGATDCTPALLSAAAAVNFAGTVRFPGTAGSVYYFLLFYANQFPGVTFDVDDGVTLSTNGDDVMSTTAEALRFARPTRFYWRTLQRYYLVGKSALLSGAHPPPTKDLWIDDSAFNRATSEAVLCNTAAITPRKMLWPTSDTWEADGFTSTTASQFQVSAGVDSYFHVGMRRVLPGDALMASMGIYSGQPYLVAMIRTTGGFHVVYATPDDVATSIDLAAKATGVAATDAALSPPWKGNHASYAPANAVWSIRIDAWDRAAFLLNGYPLATIKLNGYVVEAGFGMMGRTSSDSLVIRDVVVTHRAPPTNGTLVSVRVFGDSRSAPRYDCWPDYLPTALEYTAGMRVWKVDNQAVAGQNSTQQLAVLTSVGVSDVDVVVIDVGTNDVQGLVLVDTFRSNLTAMVNAVQAAGKVAILVNFDLWYTQGQAGTGHGQASLNYQAGAPYRSALLRVAAEKGVRVVDGPSLDGPILAHYVNSGLGLDLTSAGDSTLSDNIHPTTMLTRLRAREVAKTIAGALLPAPGVLALHNVELLGAHGWATALQRVFAQVNASGEVTLGGLFNDPGGATRTNGTVVTTLPLNLRPLWTVRARAWTDTTDNIYVNIDSSTGQVTVYGLSAAGYFGVDGITYALDDRPPY